MRREHQATLDAQNLLDFRSMAMAGNAISLQVFVSGNKMGACRSAATSAGNTRDCIGNHDAFGKGNGRSRSKRSSSWVATRTSHQDRFAISVALGGGVVGDLAGFAASIYMRGIDFINCPTTTLSMIDSSIGGKTAVDLGETKNIVGSFWQPRLVIVDPSTLATLPRRQYINGLAESVKASLLADPELFAIFEKGDIDEQIGEIIYRSLRFKKSIVEQDETEHGVRKALNFGHTIGHGIEAVKGVKGRRTVGLYHGECVALGMLPMIESKALQKRVRAVYRRLGLPLRTAYNKDKVYAEMLHDKKAQGGQITVIKVPGLGCWRAETIPVEGLRPLLGMED